MVYRGYESLDELEELERRDEEEHRSAEAGALSEVHLLEDHGVIDWSSLDGS